MTTSISKYILSRTWQIPTSAANLVRHVYNGGDTLHTIALGPLGDVISEDFFTLTSPVMFRYCC